MLCSKETLSQSWRKGDKITQQPTLKSLPPRIRLKDIVCACAFISFRINVRQEVNAYKRRWDIKTYLSSAAVIWGAVLTRVQNVKSEVNFFRFEIRHLQKQIFKIEKIDKESVAFGRKNSAESPLKTKGIHSALLNLSYLPNNCIFL